MDFSVSKVSFLINWKRFTLRPVICLLVSDPSTMECVQRDSDTKG